MPSAWSAHISYFSCLTHLTFIQSHLSRLVCVCVHMCWVHRFVHHLSILWMRSVEDRWPVVWRKTCICDKYIYINIIVDGRLFGHDHTMQEIHDYDDDAETELVSFEISIYNANDWQFRFSNGPASDVADCLQPLCQRRWKQTKAVHRLATETSPTFCKTRLMRRYSGHYLWCRTVKSNFRFLLHNPIRSSAPMDLYRLLLFLTLDG